MKLAFCPHGLDLDPSFAHGLSAAFGLIAGIGAVSLLAGPAGVALAAGWGLWLLALSLIPVAILAALRVLPLRLPALPGRVCLRYLALFSTLLTVLGALTRFHLHGFLGVGLVGLAVAAGLLYGVLDRLEGGGAEAREERAAREETRARTVRHVAEMQVAAQERLARHRREIAAFEHRLSEAAGHAPADSPRTRTSTKAGLKSSEGPTGPDDEESAEQVYGFEIPAAA